MPKASRHSKRSGTLAKAAAGKQGQSVCAHALCAGSKTDNQLQGGGKEKVEKGGGGRFFIALPPVGPLFKLYFLTNRRF